MDEFLSYLISSLASGFISVSTAIFILRLQEWRNKKKTFKALYSEVEGNLNIAQKLLPMAESISSNSGQFIGTVFDLQRFHAYCYEDFRRSGYLLSLHDEARQLLEEVYELIFSHNRQTDVQVFELIPRLGGYSERLRTLIEKLKELKEHLRPHVHFRLSILL
jgi:hypothetical protein